MTTTNTHLTHSHADEYVDYLRSLVAADVRITSGDDVPSDTYILIEGRPSREKLTSCPDLRAVVIPFAGLPVETRQLMADFPQISAHNLHHNAPMTAEMAVTLLMTAAKNIVPYDREFRKNDWTARYEGNASIILDGKTALILGYGAIGQHVGAVCRALGMKTIGIRRQASDDPDVYSPDALHDLLPRADALIICLPGTPHTEGMIGEKEISLLPKGAIIVNIGRGPIIDGEALYNALKSGHLHGAGSDVWYNYPTDKESRSDTPPADYPFGELDNMVMSPHRGGGGGAHEVEMRRMKSLSELINAATNGHEIPNRIDLENGY
jgi:phosphoglycerate dehydrogenase-like enzyme